MMKTRKRIYLIPILASIALLCLCCALCGGAKTADAEVRTNADFRSEYGTGYALRLDASGATVDGKAAKAEIRLMHEDRTVLTVSDGQVASYVLQAGNYTVIYCVYYGNKYYTDTYGFTVKDKPYFDFSALKSRYALGSFLPANVDIVSGGTRKPASLTLSAPSGTIALTGDSFLLETLGNYTLTATAEADGKIESDSFSFTVEMQTYADLFSSEQGSVNIVYNTDAPSYRKAGNGVSIGGPNGTRVRFANAVDISNFSSADSVMKFAAYLGDGYSDIEHVYLRLIDVYDETNVLTFDVYSVPDSSAVYVRMLYDDISLGAMSDGSNPGSFDPGNVYATAVMDVTFADRFDKGRAGDRTSYADLRLDCAEKIAYTLPRCDDEPFAVLKMNDSDQVGVGKEWRGFTNGEVRAEIEISGGTNNRILVTEFLGQPLSGTDIEDKTAPSVITEVNGEILPKAYVGKKYKIPAVTRIVDAIDGVVGFASLDVRLNEMNGKVPTEITDEIIDGYFTPKKPGEYRVEYYTSDSRGNRSVKICRFTAEEYTGFYELSCNLPESAFVGGSVRLPAVGLSGLSTLVKQEVKYFYNGIELKAKAGDVVKLEKAGTLSVRYDFIDYIGTRVANTKVMRIEASDEPVFEIIGVPPVAIKGKTLYLPDFTATDYRYEVGDARRTPERTLKIGNTVLDVSVRAYNVTEEEGAILTVEYGAGGAAETRQIKVIDPKTLLDYFETNAEMTEAIAVGSSGQSEKVGIDLTFDSETSFTSVNPLALSDTGTFTLTAETSVGTFSTAVLQLTDFYDPSRSIETRIDMQSGIMRIVGNSKEYPIDLSKGVDITYSNVSHSFLGVARVEKYLNGEAFDGLGEMVTATLSFEEVTAESSVRLTYFKHSLYQYATDGDYEDASVPYVVCDGEVKFDGNLLIVPAANAWKNFAGTSELKVSVRAPSGILMNRESAAKAYTFEATDYGVYTISYGMGSRNYRTISVERRNDAEIVFAPVNAIPRSVLSGYELTLPDIEVSSGEGTSAYMTVQAPNGAITLCKAGDKLILDKDGIYRITITVFNEYRMKALHYEISVGGNV